MSQINQRLGVRILSKMKYTVDTAENGQIALDKISEGRDRYGLVLMDCQVRSPHSSASR